LFSDNFDNYQTERLIYPWYGYGKKKYIWDLKKALGCIMIWTWQRTLGMCVIVTLMKLSGVTTLYCIVYALFAEGCSDLVSLKACMQCNDSLYAYCFY